MTSEFNPFYDKWRAIHLKDSSLFIYSAYYDGRKRSHSAKEGNDPVVRINVLAPKEFLKKNKNTVCLVKSKNGDIFTVRIGVILLLEHFNLKWSSYFVNCKLTQIITRKLFNTNETNSIHFSNQINQDDITFVTLINQSGPHNFTEMEDSELQVHQSQDSAAKNLHIYSNSSIKLNKLAICIKPIYNYWNRAIWLVEFLELYRILGEFTYLFGDILS
jgi:hypothetical protein